MTEADDGISIRAFAKLDGCSEKLVRGAIKAGQLKALPNGKLDPALAGTGWRRTNRRAEPGADKVRRVRTPQSAPSSAAPAEIGDVDDVDDAGFAEGASGDAIVNHAEADRRKAVALAELRELEFDQKSGRVVPIDQVVRHVGAEYARVRTRLLKLPVEQAPRLHRINTPLEIQDALKEVITQALEELSFDGETASRPN